jgi:hypothetical protein
VNVRVRFDGTPPQEERVTMKGDAACCLARGEESITRRPVAVGAGGALADAFVHVREGLEDYAFPPALEPVLLDQKGCEFLPPVLGVRTSQPIRIRNSDPTLHNVHACTKVNRAFNVGMPDLGQEIVKTFSRPEVMIELRCHVHDWMSSHVGVVDHPCFGVTGYSGTVLLEPVPPGDHVIEVWHRTLGTQEQRVTLLPREARTLEFVFRGGP